MKAFTEALFDLAGGVIECGFCFEGVDECNDC